MAKDRRQTLKLRLFRGGTLQFEFSAFCDPDDGETLQALLVDAVTDRLRKPAALIPKYRMQVQDSNGRKLRPDFVTTSR